jgi:hypothetical protein
MAELHQTQAIPKIIIKTTTKYLGKLRTLDAHHG